MADFIDLKLTSDNIDIFYHRKSIQKALFQNLKHFKGDFLDVGCGKMPYKEFIMINSSLTSYVGLDIETAIEYSASVQPDIRWDGVSMPIESDSFHTVMATEVLEHCQDPQNVLRESFRVLKTDGVFFFTVPFIWNLHETPYDFYRYTPYALEMHLQKVGFKEIEMNILGGWNASMAQMLGLWMKRSPIRRARKFKLIKPLLEVFHRKLLKLAEKEQGTFTDQPMPTGLYGIAKKPL